MISVQSSSRCGSIELNTSASRLTLDATFPDGTKLVTVHEPIR